MSFSVKATDLEDFSKVLHRAASDVEEAREYVKKSCEMFTTDIGPVSAVAQAWNGGHESAVSRVHATLRKLEQILSASSREMKRSSSYYTTTDVAESRRIDQTYPR